LEEALIATQLDRLPSYFRKVFELKIKGEGRGQTGLSSLACLSNLRETLFVKMQPVWEIGEWSKP
jgi:hypothetical protein